MLTQGSATSLMCSAEKTEAAASWRSGTRRFRDGGTAGRGFCTVRSIPEPQIDQALQMEEPAALVPSTDTNGHGTKMASAAAGSLLNQGLTFRGAAPLSDIAVVKLKGAKPYLRDYYLIDDQAEAFEENDIMEAVKYLQQMAVAFSRPVVIVIGLGTNMGSHDGTSLLETYIDNLAGLGRTTICIGSGMRATRAGILPGLSMPLKPLRSNWR